MHSEIGVSSSPDATNSTSNKAPCLLDLSSGAWHAVMAARYTERMVVHLWLDDMQSPRVIRRHDPDRGHSSFRGYSVATLIILSQSSNSADGRHDDRLREAKSIIQSLGLAVL